MAATFHMQMLIERLRRLGQQPVALQDQLLLLPRGGRVLCLCPQPGINALWLNPALANDEAAGDLFAGDDWLNLGGARTWISPSIETSLPDPDDRPERYHVAREVDAAGYRVEHQTGVSVTLSSTLPVRFNRAGEVVQLQLERTITLRPMPPVTLSPDLRFCGYTQRSTLTPVDVLPAALRPSLWQLLQVPGNGQISLLLQADAEPRTFFGDAIYQQRGRQLRCRGAAETSFKLSLRAPDSSGLMACLHERHDSGVLIVCRFPVGDRQRYAEAPLDDPGDSGHVQQVYVDDGSLGGYAELAYHSPALAAGELETVTDVGEVWAFSGRRPALHDLRRELLS